MARENSTVSTDGLNVIQIENWYIQYLLFFNRYLEAFIENTSSTDVHIYMDLSPGTGLVQHQSTGKLYSGTPYIAIKGHYPFSRYLLAEKDPGHAGVLDIRIKRDHREANVVIHSGPLGEALEKFRNLLPGDSAPSIFCNYVCDDVNVDIYLLSVLKEMEAKVLLTWKPPFRKKKTYQEYLKSLDIEDTIRDKVRSNTALFREMLQVYEERISNLGYRIQGSYPRLKNDEHGPGMYYMAYLSGKSSPTKTWSRVLEKTNPQIDLFGS